MADSETLNPISIGLDDGYAFTLGGVSSRGAKTQLERSLNWCYYRSC